MNKFTSKLFLCLFIYELGKTNALSLEGHPSSKPTVPKTALQNPFAPNSEIFKIPASKTVNLDFRKSNETKISSELLKILKDLFKNKDVRQEKVILNVKPPKNSNSSFVKNFTSILRNETIQIVPDAVVGAQSTLFKKKSGQISTLRLTLYVIRQQRVVPEKKSKMNSLKPKVEEAKINISQAENITATVELVLKQLQSNSSQDRETNILLSLVSATNLTRSYIHTLQHSVKEILAQIYPNSSISMHTKLFQNKKSHNSKLEFEIDVKPKVQRKKIILKPAIETLNMTIILLASKSTEQDEGSIFLNVTNKLENITKTLSHYMNMLSENTNTSNLTGIIINLSFSKNVGELEKQKLLNHLDNLVQEKFPKFQSYIKVTSKSEKPFNIRILLLSKSKLANEENTLTSESLQANSELLQKDLQNLQPYAQVLKRTEDTINKDLAILEKTLELQNRNNRKSKISIDLTGGVSSFPEELEKILPQVLPTLKNSKQPTLEFEITVPSYSPESTVSSDICSIVNTLLTKVPERTQFGDVNIEVTLSKKPIMLRSLISDDYISPIALSQAQINAEISHPPKPETENILDLTGNGVNTIDEINNTLTELLRMLPSQNNPRTLNLSMVLPINETSLVENILDIIRKDLKMLFPYSQILLQAQKTIADDLHILELNIELKKSLEKTNRPKKFIEEIPIDLSHLHEDIQKDLDKLLVPVWTHMSRSKPLVFNLELRPVNDISRNRLSNEICSIVDTLIKSLPSETNLNELSLRMTVTPDEDEMDMSDTTENSWKTEEILPIIVDAADSSKNETYRLHEALKKIAEELKNNLNSNTTVPYLVLHLPKTANIEEALREIKDDLSKLAPLEDIVLKSQQDLEDDVLTLQLAIEFHHENRRKKFRIELSEMGDFIPEEVDEIVYDIRQSENSFSFDLQMVLPQGADLDEGNSEICSVVNVVINNVPQQSILKDNVLRVSVSPRQNVKSEELIPSTESNEEIINLQKPNIPEKNELNSATRSLPSWPNEENVNELTKIKHNYSPMTLVNEETEYTNNMRGLNNSEWIPPKKQPIKNTWRKQISNNAPVNVQPIESVIGRENIQNPWNVVNSNSPRIFRKPSENISLNPQSSEINEEEEKQNNIMNPNVWKQFPNSMQNMIKNRLLTEPTTKSEALIENPTENEWMRNDYTTQPEELEPEPKIAEEVKSSPNVYKEFETTMSPTVRSPIANKFEELKSSLLNGLPYISPFPSARNYNQIRKQVTPRSRTLVGEAEEKVTPTQNIPKIRMITERIPTTVNSIPQGNNWVSWTPLPTQNSYSMTLEETTTNEIINEYVTESLENIERIENTPLSNTPLRNNLIETEENTNTNNIRAENEKYIVPKYDNVKEETLIKAYDNDQFGVLHYIEKIDLSNSSMNMVDVITNTTTSLIKIIPRESEETLELNLNIFLPEDTTVDDLKNVTNSVMSTLLTSLPKDIINVQTKTDEEDEKIDYAEMKITISPNTSLGRDIEEKEKLESEVKKESQLVKNLTILLDNLKTNIDSYSSVQKYLELNDQVVSEKQKSFINSNKMLLDNVYSIVSNILLAIKKDPDFKELKFNYTLEPPKDEGVSYRHLLDYSLKKLLAEYMPFEEVETNITANNNQSLLEVQVSVKPRVNFTTPTINLDSLNILDVEEVLTRIISNYISVIEDDNSIIIDFVFNTTHISSLNLENIESAIEDVLDYFNLKNELLSDDVELELIDNKFIDIHMPFKVSAPVSKKVSSSIHIQTEKPKIPKPSDMISDLILAI